MSEEEGVEKQSCLNPTPIGVVEFSVFRHV